MKTTFNYSVFKDRRSRKNGRTLVTCRNGISVQIILPALSFCEECELAYQNTHYPYRQQDESAADSLRRIPYEAVETLEAETEEPEVISSHWEEQYVVGLLFGMTAVLALALILLTAIQLYRSIHKPKRRKAGKYVKK